MFARLCARTVGQWERLYLIPLEHPSRPLESDWGRFQTFRTRAEVSDEAVGELRKYKSERALNQFLDRWFARGGTLWLYFLDRDAVGVQWTIPRGFDGFYSLPLTEKEFIIVAVEVFPPFRGRGLYPRMASHLCSCLALAGYGRAYLKVAASNEPMVRSMSKLPTEPLGRVYTRRLPGKWLTIWSQEPAPMTATAESTRELKQSSL